MKNGLTALGHQKWKDANSQEERARVGLERRAIADTYAALIDKQQEAAESSVGVVEEDCISLKTDDGNLVCLSFASIKHAQVCRTQFPF